MGLVSPSLRDGTLKECRRDRSGYAVSSRLDTAKRSGRDVGIGIGAMEGAREDQETAFFAASKNQSETLCSTDRGSLKNSSLIERETYSA